MKMKIRVLCLICAALLTLPVTALAFNNYQLDVEALKAVEATDTFEVKITGKTVTDGAGSGINNSDVLTLTLHNGMGAAVRQVTILAVAHDADGKAQKLIGGYLILSMGSEKRELNTLSFENLDIPAGGDYPLNVECSHDTFTGLRAIVAQVVTDEGTFTNPLYEEWQEVALGSPTHILD